MTRHRTTGFSLIEGILAVAIIAAIVLAGWYAYRQHSNSTTSSSGSTSGQPQIPTTGAYLGAWIHPSATTSTPADIDTSTAIQHVWASFKAPVPTDTMTAIAGNGAIPLIDWGCTNVANISSGGEDTTINNFATGLKSYGKPVFLRWYWEFNELSSAGKTPAGLGCDGYNNGSGYIAAWQHIYNLFKSDGVSNVSFVWCPGFTGGNFAAYYPGDQYVDWIGIDRYERTSKGQPLLSFNDMFSSYYNEWVGHNKPIMVAETAAMGSANQVQYLNSTASQIAELPKIKAFVYFDSVGPAGDWSLTGAGLPAFKSLAGLPYFISHQNDL